MRTALVTGASRGIGRGIACELARQGFGLTITSRTASDLESLAPELERLGARGVVHCAADLVDRDALAGVVDLHRSAFGSMDALVLNGGVGTAGVFAETSQTRIDKTIAVNLTSTVLLAQMALPLLRAAATESTRGARVILLSSITGVYAEAGMAVYGATKAAVASLADSLNVEESPNGVLATAIAPGYVDTDMVGWISDTIPTSTMLTVDDVVAVVRMLLELGRTAAIPRVVISRSGTTGYSA